MTRRAILVVGMHRSGTSALTGALGALGIALPTHLVPAHASNPKGHFEPLRIVEIHERLLAANGTSHLGLQPIPHVWFDSSEAALFADEIAAVVKEEYPGSASFVVKDPRVCLLVPLWRRILTDIGVEACFAIPVRHPYEVARSLERRNGLPLLHGYLMWLVHTLEAEHASRGAPRVFVSFVDLLSRPSQVAESVALRLTNGWRRMTDDNRLAVESFIDPSMRREIVPVSQQRDLTHPWLERACDAYNELIRSPTDDLAQQRLDVIRAQVKEAVPFLAPFVKVFSESTTAQIIEMDAVRADISAFRELNGVLRAELNGLRTDVAALVHGLRTDIAALELRTTGLERWKARRLSSKIKKWSKRNR